MPLSDKRPAFSVTRGRMIAESLPKVTPAAAAARFSPVLLALSSPFFSEAFTAFGKATALVSLAFAGVFAGSLVSPAVAFPTFFFCVLNSDMGLDLIFYNLDRFGRIFDNY